MAGNTIGEFKANSPKKERSVPAYHTAAVWIVLEFGRNLEVYVKMSVSKGLQDLNLTGQFCKYSAICISSGILQCI